jgi:hypothetical protein
MVHVGVDVLDEQSSLFSGGALLRRQ